MANKTSAFQPDPPICEPGGSGVLLPFSQDEQLWDKGPRAFIYLLLLAWCFLGVGIISDVFMNAIDQVTSQRRSVRLKNGQEISFKVWNDTVANLSLMALGSSAPEIMLNVIEIVCRDFFSGDLGPSTIVGSAAFNLMVIIAVCVMVIPEGDTRTIDHIEPFLVTAFFSIFAYLWMVVILSLATPDMVTIPEAVMTFIFFPILILVAYMADIGMFTFGGADDDAEDEQVEFIKAKVMEAGFELTTEETKMLSRMKTAEFGGGKSWAAAKVDASPLKPHGVPKQDLQIGFVSARYCFPPDVCEMTLQVEKFGENQSLVEQAGVSFEYTTVDGANMRADDGDYMQTNGSGEIAPGEMYGEIRICRQTGLPNKADRNQAFFFVEITCAVKLAAPSCVGNKKQSIVVSPEDVHNNTMPVHVSEYAARARVAVADLVGQGALRMDTDEVAVAYPEKATVARVKVNRAKGSDGEIACRFYVEDDTAKAGIDYLGVEGELVFPGGCIEKIIEVPIMAKEGTATTQERFNVILTEIDEDNNDRILVPGHSMATVTIYTQDDAGVTASAKVMAAMDLAGSMATSVAQAKVFNNDWADQFKEAFSPECDDEDQATAADWTLHVLALPWKLLFAFTPPASYCGGWLAFVVALIFIGAVTVFIGDLATLLGCVASVNSSITAITIVALGTSLPDTFASKTSAVEDPSADAAIGNVTGSNSVNVFLGLGLPWVIGSFYWKSNGISEEWQYRYPDFVVDYPDGGLVVLSGDLSFSVGVFTLCALTTLGVIWYRRVAFQAELGGPQGVKTNTSIFLVLLWIFYVSMASWKVINGKVATGQCVMAILIGILGVIIGMAVVAGGLNFITWSRESRRAEMKEVFESVMAARDEEGNEGASKPVDSSPPTVFRMSLKAGTCLTAGTKPKASPRADSKDGYEKKGAGSGMSADRGAEILAAAPMIAEGLQLRTPDAVQRLRQHLEALNVVCSSLENDVCRGGGKISEEDARLPPIRWQKDVPVPPPSGGQGNLNFEQPAFNQQAPLLSPDGQYYEEDDEDGQAARRSKTVKKKKLKKVIKPPRMEDGEEAPFSEQVNPNEEVDEPLFENAEREKEGQPPYP